MPAPWVHADGNRRERAGRREGRRVAGRGGAAGADGRRARRDRAQDGVLTWRGEAAAAMEAVHASCSVLAARGCRPASSYNLLTGGEPQCVYSVCNLRQHLSPTACAGSVVISHVSVPLAVLGLYAFMHFLSALF